MFARVAERGFDDLSQADSDVLVHVGPRGTAMAAVARARGVTKQAVQGQVRGLVERGYLELRPDPDDARARRLVHTERGLALMRALADVERALHAEVAADLGEGGMERLRRALDRAREVVEG